MIIKTNIVYLGNTRMENMQIIRYIESTKGEIINLQKIGVANLRLLIIYTHDRKHYLNIFNIGGAEVVQSSLTSFIIMLIILYQLAILVLKKELMMLV